MSAFRPNNHLQSEESLSKRTRNTCKPGTFVFPIFIGLLFIGICLSVALLRSVNYADQSHQSHQSDTYEIRIAALEKIANRTLGEKLLAIGSEFYNSNFGTVLIIYVIGFITIESSILFGEWLCKRHYKNDGVRPKRIVRPTHSRQIKKNRK